MLGQVGPNTGGAILVVMEVPSGAVNGVNTQFTFTSPPLQVFYQGILQNGTDYTLSGSTVTFNVPPESGTVSGLVTT